MSTSDATACVQAIDVDLVGARLASSTEDQRWHELDAELVSGGKSNLTFLLRSEAGALILRRPPLGKLLPSAHDMGREARIQRALDGSGVPVPTVVCEDVGGADFGVPYYVMERVDGIVIRDALPPELHSDSSRQALADHLIDILATLHSVDPNAVGLGALGKRENYLERQLRRWLAQSEKSAPSARIPAMGELAARLSARVPHSPPAAIVHGDFRLDNCVCDPTDSGRIRAVLDWELSTLGDPIADLALTITYWQDPQSPRLPLIPALTREPGWPGADYLLDRYAQKTAAKLEDLHWYRVFSAFKFAAIAQGVASRAEAGGMADQDFGDNVEQTRALVEYALDLCQESEL